MTTYSEEVRAAAERVGTTFANGCDRCDASDLDLLESEGLMVRQRCEFDGDTLRIGDMAWVFNAKGDALVYDILDFT